eukprot:CAMPEP_0183556978 /NCGR_PEP_ID=MMETSP0371-20130417/84043_1 /TAXON_ID=268820 /ORGANISM="Peridinium aciculiferum, Strain PAER-2" /LENGTH=37 /DNA_ID= /DNA_START= /DNA_END= /DNA_ORIENTATION=
MGTQFAGFRQALFEKMGRQSPGGSGGMLTLQLDRDCD